MVAACIGECRELHLKKIFALTYQEAFFTRLGFRVVEKSVLPQKIWLIAYIAPNTRIVMKRRSFWTCPAHWKLCPRARRPPGKDRGKHG